MARERDLSFEKLAEVCGVDLDQMNANTRGALNKSLALIRESMTDLTDDELQYVIEAKAKTYRKVMEGALLTPNALAKHWAGLDGMLEAQTAPTTYVSHDRSVCTTCDGVRFVLAFTRPPKDSEVYRACPDCNPEGQQLIDEYLARFNRNYSGGPRLPVPQEAKSLVQ